MLYNHRSVKLWFQTHIISQQWTNDKGGTHLLEKISAAKILLWQKVIGTVLWNTIYYILYTMEYYIPCQHNKVLHPHALKMVLIVCKLINHRKRLEQSH